MLTRKKSEKSDFDLSRIKMSGKCITAFFIYRFGWKIQFCEFRIPSQIWKLPGSPFNPSLYIQSRLQANMLFPASRQAYPAKPHFTHSRAFRHLRATGQFISSNKFTMFSLLTCRIVKRRRQQSPTEEARLALQIQLLADTKLFRISTTSTGSIPTRLQCGQNIF